VGTHRAGMTARHTARPVARSTTLAITQYREWSSGEVLFDKICRKNGITQRPRQAPGWGRRISATAGGTNQEQTPCGLGHGDEDYRTDRSWHGRLRLQ
jgi:hypothetical protein